MPRPKKPGGPEPKKRSRNGCWPCKARKVKCGEEKPKCLNCERQGEPCDYSIRLNWEGRNKRKGTDASPEPGNSSDGIYNFSRFELASSSEPVQRAYTPNPARLEIGRRDRQSSQESFAGNTEGRPKGQENKISGTDLRLRSPLRNWDAPAPQDEGLPPSEMSTVDPTMTGTQHTRNLRDQISTTQISRLREQKAIAYPSPVDSNMASPSGQAEARSSHGIQNSPMPPAHMLPPLQSPSFAHGSLNTNRLNLSDFNSMAVDRSKRMRYSSPPGLSQNSHRRNHSSPSNSSHPFAGVSNFSRPLHSPQASSFLPYSPSLSNVSGPLTPITPSAASEDSYTRPSTKPSPSIPHDSSDSRRLSVDSLLSGPPGGGQDLLDAGNSSITQNTTQRKDARSHTTAYGFDRGFPDLDVPRNDDLNVLNGEKLVQDASGSIGFSPGGDPDLPAEFGFGLYGMNTVHRSGGYYVNPVPVIIPNSLSPLPFTLQENPMNLLYFHHFLNHTARILVPHDCSENPFKNILPQMAIQDINLLHLLLAYSASHRARLLNHPEPANRIAIWVRDVFPTLRHALNDTVGHISNANLATAIMLASLEIISPNTFEVPVPWQNHLNTARRMIIARGGAQSVHRKDKVSYFLSRWFAYLDVLGSLSGGKNDQPLFSGNYWAHDDDLDEENDFQIDCLLGFTSRCVSILAKIAELARQCDSERIDNTANVRADWRPSPQIIEAAEKLKSDLQEARTHRYKGCPHRQAGSEIEDGWDSLEMVATNEAFHWAGLVHLYRRVLGKPSEDAEVQNAVREILGALFKIRKGGTAEACLLFPMFTAGCDAKEGWQRERIMDRLRCVEGLGMTQVHKARRLMEKVWETGRPWETLVQGEFFG